MKLLQFNRKIDSGAIRERYDIIRIIVEACEYVVDNQYKEVLNINEIVPQTKAFIFIDKMTRLFIVEDKQIFSVVFPFNVNLIESKVTFHHFEINHSVLAAINSIVHESMELYNIESLIDCIWENTKEMELTTEEKQIVDQIIYHLMSYEMGYIRYDVDPINAQKYNERGKPNIHPENHFDINYTSSATYKVGLKSAITMQDFVDFLNINTDCWFVKSL